MYINFHLVMSMLQGEFSPKAESYYHDLADHREKDSVANHYDKWADDYEEVHATTGLLELNKNCTNTLAKYLVGKDLDILDVACGTGLTGEYLHKLGYTRIDGVDGSNNMMKKAHEKKIYASLKQGRITRTESLPCSPNTYDGIICVAAIARNAIDMEYALRDFVRISKPGGIVTYTINHEGLPFMEEHGKLMQDGTIEMLYLQRINYVKGVIGKDLKCYLCVIRVL